MITIKRTDLNTLVLSKEAEITGKGKRKAKPQEVPLDPKTPVVVVEENADAMKDLVKALSNIVPAKAEGLNKDDLREILSAVQTEPIDRDELRNIFVAITRAQDTQARLIQAIEKSTPQDPIDNSDLIMGIAKAVQAVQQTQTRLIEVLGDIPKPDTNANTDLVNGLKEAVQSMAERATPPDFSGVIASIERIQSTQTRLIEAIANIEQPQPQAKNWTFKVERGSNGLIKQVVAQGE